MKTKLFDNESSTEFSIIGKSLDGTIILWNAKTAAALP